MQARLLKLANLHRFGDIFLLLLAFIVTTEIEGAHFNGATVSWKSSKTTPNTATFFWKAGFVIGKGPCGTTCDDTKLNTYGTYQPFYLGDWKCYAGCNTQASLSAIEYWITSYNIDENYEQGENSFTHTFDSDHGIEVGFKKGNWRSLNAGTAGSWAIVTTVDLRARSDTGYANNSPTTVSKPVFRYQFSCDSVLSIPLVDPDGDIVKCRWAVGAECASVCNAFPGATLDEDTCTVDFSTGTSDGYVSNGWYAVALMMTDYPRENITVGGVLKTPDDELSTVPLQFLVTTPSYGATSCDSKPSFIDPTPVANTKYRVSPSDNIIIKIYATNAVDPLVRVSVYSVSAPTGLLRTAVRDDDLGIGNATYIALYWTPTIAQKGENIICVMAQDDNGKTSEYRCYTVLAWDYDECLSNPCINDGTCVNLEDRFLCLCPTGYFGGVHCEIDIHDSCIGNGCQNNATCVDGAYNYTCQCVPGYVGFYCETDYDECHSNPCQNNGTCNDLINKYTCDCLPGFNGYNCENNIDECYSSPCWKGSCNDEINQYSCTCNLGWTGTNCFLDVDECASNPCQNNATCMNNEAYYICMCQPGFAGTHCEIEIDECASTPCQNNGTCSNLINKFECECDVAFTGSMCQTNIDECASTPCQNSGVCVDLLSGYRCDCVNSWFGTHCEYNIDPCWSFPCLYGSKCINLTTTYRCECASGWMGHNCEHDFNECVSSPCPQNATCINKVNLYECECLPGWSGPNCDIKTNVMVLPPNSPVQNPQNSSSSTNSSQKAGHRECSCNSTSSNSNIFSCQAQTICTCLSNGKEEVIYDKSIHCQEKIWPNAMLATAGCAVGAAVIGLMWAATRITGRASVDPLFECSQCGHTQTPSKKYAKSASTLRTIPSTSSITATLMDKDMLHRAPSRVGSASDSSCINRSLMMHDLNNARIGSIADVEIVEGKIDNAEISGDNKGIQRTESSNSLAEFIANL